MDEVRTKIKGYLSRSLTKRELDGDENIFDLGLVHSMSAIQLILFIEKEFGVELEDEEMDFAKISTLNEITSLVMQKM